jgi:hypothetical protein
MAVSWVLTPCWIIRFSDVADEAAHSIFSGTEFSSGGCRNDQTAEMCRLYVGSWQGLWPSRAAERK